VRNAPERRGGSTRDVMSTNGISTMIHMTLARAVPYVTGALAAHGFDVVQSIGMRSQKRAEDGSRIFGFRVLGVSNRDIVFQGANGTANAIWCNVFLSEHSENAVKVMAVDPLPSVAAADPSAMNIRLALSKAILSL